MALPEFTIETLEFVAYVLFTCVVPAAIGWARAIHRDLGAIKNNTQKHATDIAVLTERVDHINEKVERIAT